MAIGYEAMALTDRDGVYGAVRFHEEARRRGVRAIIGAELTLTGGYALPILALTEEGACSGWSDRRSQNANKQKIS